MRALPEIRTAGYYPLKPDSFRREYCHPTIALHQHYYDCRLKVGDRTLEIRSGDVTFSPARVTTRYELAKEGFHHCVHFFPASSGGRSIHLPLHIPLGPSSSRVFGQMQTIGRFFARGQADLPPDHALCGMAARVALQGLLLWLAVFDGERRRFRATPKNTGKLQKCIEILDSRFRESLSISQLSREIGLSQNYLSAQFRRSAGVTINQYLRRKRMELARHWLATTRLPVKVIAAESGIPDPQYFNKQFRQCFGVSPARFGGRI